MRKYTIKNCPAYQTFYSDTTDGSSSILCTKGFTKSYCQDCTDCVMKQIVENCRNKIRIYECYNSDYALGKVKCAESILQLFDIQEILE